MCFCVEYNQPWECPVRALTVKQCLLCRCSGCKCLLWLCRPAGSRERTVNLGQVAPGWCCLITAKHRGMHSETAQQYLTPSWLLACEVLHYTQTYDVKFSSRGDLTCWDCFFDNGQTLVAYWSGSISSFPSIVSFEAKDHPTGATEAKGHQPGWTSFTPATLTKAHT